MDRSYLSRIESGAAIPSRAQVEKMIDSFGIEDIDERMKLLLAVGYVSRSDVDKWAQTHRIKELRESQEILGSLRAMADQDHPVDGIKPEVVEMIKELTGDDQLDQMNYLIKVLSNTKIPQNKVKELLQRVNSLANLIADQL